MQHLQIPDGPAFWEDVLLPMLPEFTDIYAEELSSYGDDSFLDHLMFAALARYMVGLWRSGEAAVLGATHRPRRRRKRDRVPTPSERALAALEEGLARGTHDLREPIIVSLIEYMQHEMSEQEQRRFLPSLPPNFSSAWGAVERWMNQPHRSNPDIPYERIHWEPVRTKGSPQ